MILLDPDARPVIGHRGASGQCPENTLSAFAAAVEAGADAIEFDVRATLDLVPVVIHDEDVARTTDGNGLVRSMPISRIRSFDSGGGQTIPLLDEVLDGFRSLPMIVEIKEKRAAAAVRARIDKHGARDRVLVGSFHHRALAGFDRDRYLVCAARVNTAGAYLSSRVGLGFPGGFRAFCIPERSGSLRIVDRRFVAAARRNGRPVHVWTVDDRKDGTRLRAIGVSGLITNYPRRMTTLEAG